MSKKLELGQDGVFRILQKVDLSTVMELKAEVDRMESQRAATRAEIGSIQTKRQQWIRDNAAKNEGAGMDEAMAEALAEQL